MVPIRVTASERRRARRSAKTQPMQEDRAVQDTGRIRLQDSASEGLLTVAIIGSLDNRLSTSLWRTLHAASGNRSRIVIDLGRTREQHDTGFALLTVFVRRARATGIAVEIANADAGQLARWPSLAEVACAVRPPADSARPTEGPPRVPATWLMMIEQH